MSCDISSTRLNLEFFAAFQNIYLFIPRFLAEPLTMFRGTLVGKHCSRLWPLVGYCYVTSKWLPMFRINV
jgi:hypothetical protein